MKKYITEGIGSFFLTLIFLLTANLPSVYSWMPLAYAAFLIALGTIFYTLSGAHFNPLITFTAFLRGHIDRIDAIYYVLSQVAGALAASLFATLLLSAQGVTDLNPQAVPAFTGLLCELMGAFLVACAWAVGASGHRYNWRPGAVMPGIMYAFRGISGGFFNPAVALGSMVIGRVGFEDAWLYTLAAAMGAAAATTFLSAANYDEIQHIE